MTVFTHSKPARPKIQTSIKAIESDIPCSALRRFSPGHSGLLQPVPQGELEGGHFTVVRVMVVPEEVKKSVKNQPSDLGLERVALHAGVSTRRLDGDHYVTQEVPEFSARSPVPGASSHPSAGAEAAGSPRSRKRAAFILEPGKSQHVRRPGPPQVGRVQFPNLPVAHATDVKVPSPQSQQPPQRLDIGFKRMEIQGEFVLPA
ncbi:MAG: hypothetical protein AUI53_04270 [Acidobacteria bacterium 13_1_40CM_2_60_7]|nr:MAG: hypothetical protein AUI53_04270 [Acidobacteria bacterium 13_1_40CM_2_60_7]